MVIDEIIAKKNGRVWAQCGCLCIPEVVALIFKVEIICPRHGPQDPVRVATQREVNEYTLELSYGDESDIPGF